MGSGQQEIAAEPPSRATDWVAVLVSPLVWVLFLAAFFDGVSDNWVHAALLSAVGVLVARDALRATRGIEPPPPVALLSSVRRPRATLVFTAGAAIYAAVAGGWIRYSWPDTAAILLPGIAMLVIGWRGALWPRPELSGRINPTPWLVALVALALWELFALLSQPNLQTDSQVHPTISVLMDPVLASHLGRSLGLLGWLLAGWYVLGRAPARRPDGGTP